MLLQEDPSKFWDLWDTQWAQQQGIELTPEFKELFSSMVAIDPSKRPTFKQLLEHPWLHQFDSWTQEDLQAVSLEMHQIDSVLKAEAVEERIKSRRQQDGQLAALQTTQP